MEAKIGELKKDMAELEALAEQATRPKVKGILVIEARKIATELISLQEQVSATSSLQADAEKPTATTSNKRYQLKVSNYGYDDELKYIVFHVNIPNVQKVPDSNVDCKITKRNIELTVVDVDNKDYVFKLNNLAGEIVPEKSTWKLKKDRVEVKCAKETCELWNCVTEYERKASEAKKPDLGGDPQDGLFSLIKDMYDKGDDSMKQTIAKAWEESHMKQPKF